MTKILAATIVLALSFASVAAACGCNTNDIKGPLRAKMIEEFSKNNYSKYSVCMRSGLMEKNLCFNEEARGNPRGFVKVLKKFQN